MKRTRTTAVTELGLREQNRLDKLQRIKTAAKELFAELGYDRATTRDIARRAHVGLGTLFNYVDDKRDLVFLIYNEELDRITDRAFGSTGRHGTLIDQLASAFGVFYREFAANPMLARILLRELNFYSEGRLAGDFQRSKRRTIGRIEQLITAAQQAGRLDAGEDAAFIALSIFFLYSGAVRYWIAAARPNPREGTAQLRRLLRYHLSGALAGQRRSGGGRRGA